MSTYSFLFVDLMTSMPSALGILEYKERTSGVTKQLLRDGEAGILFKMV